MGGHGGLNILPQKKWNVYNYENREKVRKDEEAAAREEQLKREQSRKRDSEFRLQQLRRARGVDPDSAPTPPPVVQSDSNHINLFDGIKILDPVEVVGKVKEKEQGEEGNKRKKMKKEEVRVVGPEDEKYRLGYGVAGKGVKAPWYTTMRPGMDLEDEEREGKGKLGSGGKTITKTKTKKTVEELREERLKREKAEKEKERALLLRKGGHYPQSHPRY